MRSMDIITHFADPPEWNPRGDKKTTARLMKSSIQMYPDKKDLDTFTAMGKRPNLAKNQFTTSAELLGSDYGEVVRHRTPMKKMTK